MNEVREVLEMRERNSRIFRERLDSFDLFSDREFRNRYRLSKASVRFVIGLVTDRLESHTDREKDLSPAMQVLIALRFYAKGCYQQELEIYMAFRNQRCLESSLECAKLSLHYFHSLLNTQPEREPYKQNSIT